MSQEITNCPMCSTKLKMINGRMTCKECGYYLRNTALENTYTEAPESPKATKNNSTAKGLFTAFRSVSAIIGIAIIIGIGKTALKYALTDIFVPERREEVTSWAEEIDYDNLVIQEESGFSAIHPDIMHHYPESDFFIHLSEAIWGKAYTVISSEEYASLTALLINRADQEIYYQIDNEDILTLTFTDNLGMDFEDLTCFTGLEWLSVDSSLYAGDLDGLNHLYAVHTENSIAEYVEIIPHPENILELSAEEYLWSETLAGIENFPNLMSLTVDYDALTDISALTSLPNLYDLSLLNCNDLTDYSPLMSLPGLKYLSIQSTNLKSIDFVEAMPLLTGLAIEDSQLTDLSALEACTGLTQLYLMDNYYVNDYSIISDLTQLYSLTFSANYDSTLPSLAKLTQLTELTMDGVDDISLLKDAPNLTYLSMSNCSGEELESITALQELLNLTIHDFGTLTESVEPLTRLPKLQVLNLSETSIFGNMEEIFGIPTLRYIYLDECQVGMDFSRIPENNTLEILSMNDIRVLAAPSYNSGTRISFAGHEDIFTKFPNLSELYVASLGLENIDFVTSIPNLQYLDISNNNITSLKPLENLSNFQAVWCGSNTILETLPANSPIQVITSDYYY